MPKTELKRMPNDFTGLRRFEGLTHMCRDFVFDEVKHNVAKLYTACRMHMFDPLDYDDPGPATCMMCIVKAHDVYPVVTEEFDDSLSGSE